MDEHDRSVRFGELPEKLVRGRAKLVQVAYEGKLGRARFKSASCSHGSGCQYAHGEAQLWPQPDNTGDSTSERAKKQQLEEEDDANGFGSVGGDKVFSFVFWMWGWVAFREEVGSLAAVMALEWLAATPSTTIIFPNPSHKYNTLSFSKA
ncbi:zinc finger CCCH domain-containing protein 24 [Prunus yedoensis var. nudiflora]|uniref:Zinc finger CCCH domain-containing protein 24 n=1 Tax=Prunus yedoensis var. nudiflora TaxID=2094558 RepID=A0A314UD93_PRUYE|nr:zinc finger CCCH domain-containing protein 24 [Prunus yedoensis var. nudiflora]